MSPENLISNIWSLERGECFETTGGDKVNGPLASIRIFEYPELELLSAQLPDGSRAEIAGLDFEKAVNDCTNKNP